MFVSYHVFYSWQEYTDFVNFLKRRKIPHGLYTMRVPDRLRNANVFAVVRLVVYRQEDHDKLVQAFGDVDESLFD